MFSSFHRDRSSEKIPHNFENLCSKWPNVHPLFTTLTENLKSSITQKKVCHRLMTSKGAKPRILEISIKCQMEQSLSGKSVWKMRSTY